MIIRAARPEDAGGIARVHVQSWRSTYRGLVPDEYLAKLSVEARERFWNRQLEKSPNAENVVLVAENESGAIAGFVSGGPQRDEGLDYRGELYAIYLLEDAQGRGAGRGLMQALARELHAAGYRDLMLWVLTTNRSRQFYEHMGGQFITTKAVEIGGAPLKEAAYGWPDIGVLLQ
ncbi:MAG TPA: GNAT family N-acetyltransferase [Symbiobacteriaceae bacterium]|jgi:L-amino acid N-acyltransferase YncA|nr:GNAT family N-acetyltransferase [Symbiobacteriaceae bacterium]